MIPLRLGFLFLLIFGLMFASSRLRVRFSGKRLFIDETSIEYKVRRDSKSKSVTSVAIGLELPDKFRFRARAENSFDRIAKWFGIARELQTQDEGFDEAVYIISDDPDLSSLLTADQTLRNVLKELVNSNRYVQCSNGMIWVEMGDRGFGASDLDGVVAGKAAARVLRPLLEARKHICNSAVQSWKPSRDPRSIIERLLLTSTAILGAIGLIAFFFSLDHQSFPKQITHENIDRLAIDAASIATVALTALLLLAIRASSRTHLLLAEVLLVGAPSAWFISQAYFDRSNRVFDTAPAAIESVTIQRKYTTSGKSTHYYLVMRDWPASRAEESISVPRHIYYAVDQGQCVQVKWHRGYYNDAWISDFVPRPQSCERRGS